MATTKMSDVKIPENTEWLTLKQGAAYAQVSYPRFTEAVKFGELPASRVPGYTNRGARVRRRDIDTWLEESHINWCQMPV